MIQYFQHFLLSIDLDHYFVRLGSPSRKLLDLSFSRECAVSKLAADLNLAPPIVALDLVQEVMILPFLKSQSVNLHKEKSLLEAVGLLKHLHRSQTTLSFSDFG